MPKRSRKHAQRNPRGDLRRWLASRRGVVLLVVLVVVMMLSLGAYTYVMLMRSHRESSVLTNKQLQAKMMVDSGVDYVRIFLMRGADAQVETGGKYNNLQAFKQLAVIPEEDPKQRGYFTIVAPALDDEGNLAGVRFGLEDESTRLNLNTLITIEKTGVASMAASANSIASLTANMQSGDPSAAGDAAGALAGAAASSGVSMASTSSSGSSSNAARQFLMAIPAMTETVADSILDWIDEDDEPREYGAEVDYYMTLEPAYAPKNGPLDTVEELLRVKGVTPELLFGADTNRNGQIDPNEGGATSAGAPSSMGFAPAGAAATAPAADSAASGVAATGSLDRGWSAYLTLHSRERNFTPEGQPRIFLNNPDLTQLHAELTQANFPAEWVNFIIAYRQGSKVSGGSSSSNQQSGSASGGSSASSSSTSGGAAASPGATPAANPGASPSANPGGAAPMPQSGGTGSQTNATPADVQPIAGKQVDLAVAAKTKFTQVLDLVDATIQVKFQGEEKAVKVASPFKGDVGSMTSYMPQLMDYVTVNPSPSIPGRINILQAPAPVLRGIPGMNDDILEQILSRREQEVSSEQPNRRHETWLLTEGIVTMTEMKLLQPFICSGGHTYRAQVVGYFQNGEAAARAEAIFDATGQLPRVVLWRDMSHLGRGYALETLGIDYSEGAVGQPTAAASPAY